MDNQNSPLPSLEASMARVKAEIDAAGGVYEHWIAKADDRVLAMTVVLAHLTVPFTRRFCSEMAARLYGFGQQTPLLDQLLSSVFVLEIYPGSKTYKLSPPATMFFRQQATSLLTKEKFETVRDFFTRRRSRLWNENSFLPWSA